MSGLVSFLKCMVVMDLSLAMKDVARMGPAYQKWVVEATPFAKAHGVAQAFAKASKKFVASRYEFSEEMAEDFAASLKTALPKFVADTSITHEQLALFKDLALFMRRDSAPAWTRISKNVSLLRDNKLSELFISDDTKDIADMSVAQSMEKIVYALTKRKNDPILTINEMRDFKGQHPKLIEQYSDLRKKFKLNFNKYLLKFVRTSGKQLVDIERARSYLTAMGCNYLPSGFVGKVDERGKLFTSAGKELRGTMFGRMEMNKAYDPKSDNTYYAKLVGDMRGELRTVEFLKQSKAKRMNAVQNFSEGIEKHRKNWLKDLDSLEQETQVIAAIVETIHLTQARVGGEGNENDGVPTYGISTLLAKHMRVTAQGIEMKYPGKKGTMQHHALKPNTQSTRKVIAVLKQCLRNKKPNDRVFTAGGRQIKPREINSYLKSIGVNVTIHKFRHAAATKTAMDMLDKSPFGPRNKPTQAQAERWLKTEAVKIGEMLHHRTGSGDKQKVTSSTAIAAYIDPSIIKNWFDDLGLRVPKWLPAYDD